MLRPTIPIGQKLKRSFRSIMLRRLPSRDETNAVDCESVTKSNQHREAQIIAPIMNEMITVSQIS